MNKIYYFDYNSTTPIDPRVFDAMLPYLKDSFANAASSHHLGLSISQAVKDARAKVADLIGAEPSEIVFTSGATESINIGLKGYALANQEKGRHIITLQTEHKAVLDTCKYLETIGFEVTYLPVQENGIVDLKVFEDAIRPDTILASVMAVNNEIGVIQPIKNLVEIAHRNGASFFSDATQAVGKLDFNVSDWGVDFLAFSAHKFYGAKGAGGLYIKNLKQNKAHFEIVVHGGGHENGLRSGTLNVPAIVAMGKASSIALQEMNNDHERISVLRNELEKLLLEIDGAFINGSTSSRMYNITNICFPSIDANILIGKLKDIAISNGSACTSALVEPSHVLKAIGLSDGDALGSIRFSLGKFTTTEEITYVVKNISNIIREMYNH